MSGLDAAARPLNRPGFRMRARSVREQSDELRQGERSLGPGFRVHDSCGEMVTFEAENEIGVLEICPCEARGPVCGQIRSESSRELDRFDECASGTEFERPI